MFYQITKPRLRLLDVRWRSTFKRFCGPVPAGLGIASLLAESNGNEDPTVRDIDTNPVGLMQIAQRDGRRYGYEKEDLQKPTINVFVWCAKTNTDSQWISQLYSTYWSAPVIDYWLMVRLLFIVGQDMFKKLLSACSDAGNKTANVLAHLNTTSLRYGRYQGTTLRRIVVHLEEVRTALIMLHGLRYQATSFGQTPLKNPGSDTAILEAVTRKDH